MSLLECLPVIDIVPVAQLRKRIYKGVPDRWRPAVWPAVAVLTPGFAPADNVADR